MTRRQRTEIRARAVASLFEAAGWRAENNGSHVILRRAGQAPVTLADPVSRNSLAEVRRALGVSYRELTMRQRGKTPSPTVWRGRLELAQRLRQAGFDGIFIDRLVHLRSLYGRGFHVAELDSLSPDELVTRYVREGQPTDDRQTAPAEPATDPLPAAVAHPQLRKGQRAGPAPAYAPAYGDRAQPGDGANQGSDADAILSLLAEMSDRLSAAAGADSYRVLAARREEKVRAARLTVGRVHQSLGELLGLLEGDGV